MSAKEEWVINEKFRRCPPGVSPKSVQNAYSEPDASQWHLRGATYLDDRTKVPSECAAYSVVGANAFRTQSPVYHSAESVKCLERFLKEHPESHYIVIAWVLPGPPFHTVVQLFKRTLKRDEDPIFDFTLDNFLSQGEEYQKSRFKFICSINEAPWALKVAVSSLGGERPVLLLQKLESHIYSGSNYLEIDVSIASSRVASMLNSQLVRAANKLLVDMAFTIEGKTQEELPERTLATLRWHFCAIDEIAVTLDAQGEIKSLDVSRPYVSFLDSDMDVEGVIGEMETEEGTAK
eukprot:c2903_g1_i1.p1 GENE.c2903_g1_i1~~c2903_g1_i1.p1  ORF type:complete len:305 (+),score=34.53 c2903_g1_i1:40-915(+)